MLPYRQTAAHAFHEYVLRQTKEEKPSPSGPQATTHDRPLLSLSNVTPARGHIAHIEFASKQKSFAANLLLLPPFIFLLFFARSDVGGGVSGEGCILLCDAK